MMARPRPTLDRHSELINIIDYIKLLKRITLIVGYVSLVASSVGLVVLTACATYELQNGDKLEVDHALGEGGHVWPKWSRTERGVVMAAVAIIDAGQAMVSALLIIGAHQEWPVLVTPWLLHSALWLPAQGAAVVAGAPPVPNTPWAFILASLCFSIGVLVWLRVCTAVRDFQRVLSARHGPSPARLNV